MFYLYWDESDEHDPSYEKIRRAAYATLAEARFQAMHDLGCIRCRTNEEGQPDIRLAPTGIEPLDSKRKEKCRDCGGTKITPSKNILRIEQITPAAAQKFHQRSKGVANPELNSGKVVWEPKRKAGKIVWED